MTNSHVIAVLRVSAMAAAFCSITTLAALGDPAQNFAFILPAGSAAVFSQATTLSITFAPVDAEGIATCHRAAIKKSSQVIQFWFDTGTSTSNIMLAPGSALRAISCTGYAYNTVIGAMYVTGSWTPPTGAKSPPYWIDSKPIFCTSPAEEPGKPLNC